MIGNSRLLLVLTQNFPSFFQLFKKSCMFFHSIFTPSRLFIQVRTATKKTGGSSRNGRDSRPKFLGVKVTHATSVQNGQILALQRGLKWHPGVNVIASKTHALHSTIDDGVVLFHYDLNTGKRIVSVLDKDDPVPRDLFYPTRDYIKKLISERVDGSKYVALGRVAKYRYIREVMKSLVQEITAKQLEYKEKACMQRGLRRFRLLDLTLV